MLENAPPTGSTGRYPGPANGVPGLCILTKVQGDSAAGVTFGNEWIWGNLGSSLQSGFWEGLPIRGTHPAESPDAFSSWLGEGAWDGKVCRGDPRALESGLVMLEASSGAPSPKGLPTWPALPTLSAGAELCVRKAWLRSAYKSHNAAPARRGELQLPRGHAHGGPPTPRGLQSHVQASLVNSARARASDRASKLQPTCQEPRRPGRLHGPPTSAALREHPKTPLQLGSVQIRAPPGSQHPPHCARSRGMPPLSHPHRGPTRAPIPQYPL
jgi:hypothetical protein